MTTEGNDQLTLVRPPARPPQKKKQKKGDAASPATFDPVARILVDIPLAHLDRPFDYLVPEEMSESAQPGVRVRVRFAGQEVGGYVLERAAETDHVGVLAPVRRVVSPESVLAPEIAALARAVAERYAGTVADVLRLAIPPRHGRAETSSPSGRSTATPVLRASVVHLPTRSAGPVDPAAGATRQVAETAELTARPAESAHAPRAGFSAYEHGAPFLEALRRGAAPRGVWAALPGEEPGRGPRWAAEIAAAVAAMVANERGVIVAVPDHRDVATVAAALDAAIGKSAYVALTADLGAERRYRRWLDVRRGNVRVVVGTRAAAFAPVHDLGLVVIWDDGDDLHAEPRAPYPHVREVLLMRAESAGAAALVGGFAVTAEGAQLVRSGWASRLRPERSELRVASPRLRVLGAAEDQARDAAARTARLPSVAWETAREALTRGPVLVQVARRGYAPALACEACRTAAACPHCAGPLALSSASSDPECRWCGRPVVGWTCPECGQHRLRAPVVGAARTAEELGRAFPSVPILVSGGDHVLASVPDRPALVIATTGAEPSVAGGYAAALLLDGWLLLARNDLRAGEEALRRWLTAAALVRPAAAGGVVVLGAPAQASSVQALVRWDPFGHAERELADRRASRLPPAAALATLTGAAAAVREVLETLAEQSLPGGYEVLGPVPAPATTAAGPSPSDGYAEAAVRAIVRCPPRGRALFTAALHTTLAQRSARKADGPVRVHVDPVALS